MADDAGGDVLMDVTEQTTVPEPSSSLFRHIDEETFPRTQAPTELGIPAISTEDDMQQDSHASSGSSGGLSSDVSSMDEDQYIDDNVPITPPNGPHHFVQVMIPPRPKLRELPYSTSQTGLVYDVRMRFHTEIVSYDEMANDFHPEDPRRIHEIYMKLKDAGLVVDRLEEKSEEMKRQDKFKLWHIETRAATPAEICAVHTREHYQWVKGLTSEFPSS